MRHEAERHGMLKTRELIVETADRMFYEGGFEATSFADIAASLGISRGNFYHHFKTKDDILDAVITRRIVRTRAMLDAWHDNGGGPRERIASFVRLLVANRTKIMAFGCPVGTLCAELAKLEHAAKHRAADVMGLFRDWLTDQFRALGAREASGEHAVHLLGWAQGLATLAVAFQDEAMIHQQVATTEAWLAALPYGSTSD